MNKNFWIERLGEGWTNKLAPTLKSDYMVKLMTYLNKEYENSVVYPKKSQVFKAFQMTSWEDLRVVIIEQDPYFTPNTATGLAFANEDTMFTTPSPSLKKIWERVEIDFDNGLRLDFDLSLESWANQGVLLLNSALTVRHYEPNSHEKPWSPFINSVIETIDTNNTGIIFMLWGEYAKQYANIISNNNHILLAEHPAYAARQSRLWNCNNFIECNRLLKEMNNEQINW